VRRIVLVSGTSNLELSRRIAKILDVPLVDPQIRKFANGEIHCQIEKNVRGADVFVIQSLTNPVNDNIMELLIILDAIKRSSSSSLTAVIPHYGYSRQDRKVSPRTPITAKLVADLLTTAGSTRVMTMDLHAGQIQGFFNIPFDNILPIPIMLEYIQELNLGSDAVFVSPDSGGVERVREYAKKFKCDIALIDKRRVAPNVAKAYRVVGEVKGKDVIIFDDMIDTAGTLVEAARVLKQEGCGVIRAFATHGVFSAPALERISQCEELDSVIVTDTVPVIKEVKAITKIKILSVADLLAKAIHRTYNHDSVSSLFV